MSKDVYSLGKCKGCNKDTALKNGYCQKCNKFMELKNIFDKEGDNVLDALKDLFGGRNDS